jgi:hypothetical protein
MTVTGFGGRAVLAEVELAQIVLPAGPNEDKWAKAAITQYEIPQWPNPSATGGGGFATGTPIRWFANNVTWFRYGLEVRGTGTYAWMIGKVYFFEGM